MQHAMRLALIATLALALPLSACNKTTDDTDDETHTEELGGVMHAPGKADPLTHCVACHGSDLGGGSAPSCYDCHSDADHTVDHGGVDHGSGTCQDCHGPDNSGGLGPACTDCHS